MSASFSVSILGWRKPQGKNIAVPNIADSDNDQSIAISELILHQVGVPKSQIAPARKDPGKILEDAVCDSISASLSGIPRCQDWIIERGRKAQHFSQYSHMRKVESLLKGSQELRMAIGADYLVTPDVTVAFEDKAQLMGSGEDPILHAAISCKWTIRSDRVQNIRHEFAGLIRHRRGRQPHLVTVTAEPLPSRIVAISRGTGEVDAVYHIAFDALDKAVKDIGNPKQKDAWEECVKHRRVLPYEKLSDTLISW